MEGFYSLCANASSCCPSASTGRGVLQSGTGWIHCPLTHAQMWILLVTWACNTDVHEPAEGLCVDAALCCLGKMKGLIKPEPLKT